VIELERPLVEELEALAPLDAQGASWEDVARRAGLRPGVRRRGYRPAILVCAALAVVLGVGTAASAAFGWKVSPFWSWVNSYPPGRTGPIVTVFSGRDWDLVAWKSTKGICTSYGAPGVSGSGCSPLPRRPLAMDFGGGVSRSQGRIIGTVSARVVRVEVRLPGGRSFRARISRRLPELGTTRRFFLAEGPLSFVLNHETRFTLLAYDANGHVVGRFG
jgi:hypothetical protein